MEPDQPNAPEDVARPSRLEGTAYHEAGHAVASFALDLGVQRVHIIPDRGEEGALGCCVGDPFPQDIDLDNYLEPEDRERVEHYIMAFCAGHLAEMKRSGQVNHVGAWQ